LIEEEESKAGKKKEAKRFPLSSLNFFIGD
jgi:hypothetical protein